MASISVATGQEKYDIEYCGIVVNPIMAPSVARFSLPLMVKWLKISKQGMVHYWITALIQSGDVDYKPRSRIDLFSAPQTVRRGGCLWQARVGWPEII